MSTQNSSTANLWQKYLDLKAESGKHLYPRNAAEQFNVSECALMLANPDSVYLGNDVRPVILALKNLGLVECIVRNDLAVHEKTGVYENVTLTKTVGIALNVGELDLRIFTGKWAHIVAVKDGSRDPVSYSIQFFDEYGTAIQKVFLRDDQKTGAWHELVTQYKCTATPVFAAPQAKKVVPYTALPADRLAEFQQRWLELKDIHHFIGILETFEIDRLSAYKQAPADHAFQVDANAFEYMLQLAVEKQNEVMFFVGNRGIVQIQSGQVHNVKRMHGWLNILDKKEERFCLHLKDTALSQIWVVRRPSRDGIITCLEGFDANNESVIIMFGRREEGSQEQSTWREMTQTLINDHLKSA